jgi:hypothetical protein
VAVVSVAWCASTDGSACISQIPPVECPKVCPPIPNPFICQGLGSSCDCSPCCDGSVCQTVGKNKICVAVPPGSCCSNATECLPSTNVISGGDLTVTSQGLPRTKHYCGKKGHDFDGRRRDHDDSWLSTPDDGSGYTTTVSFDTDNFKLKCSTKHAYLITIIMSIDNNDKNDEEVGKCHHRHSYDKDGKGRYDKDGRGRYEEKIVTIKRKHFSKAKEPVVFPIIFRHLQCNSSHWEFKWFHGVGFPTESKGRKSPASIIHFSAALSRFNPTFYTASQLTLGNKGTRGQLAGGIPIISSLNSDAGYLVNSQPFAQLPYGAVQIEFLINFQSLATGTITPTLLLGRVEYVCFNSPYTTLVIADKII